MPKQFLAIIFLALSLSSMAAKAEPWKDPNPVDWTSLSETCRSDWNLYERRIVELRQTLTSEIKGLTKKQYTDRFLSDDPKILFVQITWPDLLRGKDEFWRGYIDCSDLHREARQALDSSVAPKSAKKNAVESFSDCVYTRFTRGKKMPPLDNVVACYAHQLTK